MAMAKSIADIVDDIRNATYGREVRTAIADGIQTCYTDVSNSKTIADASASSANSAAIRANNASSAAEEVVDEYNSQVRTGTRLIDTIEELKASCEALESSASDKAVVASKAAAAATDKASQASTSATTALQKASQASDFADAAADSADRAYNSAASASSSAESASSSASSAADSARSASASASTATTKASQASESASTAAAKAVQASDAATSASESASTATTKASQASESAESAASSATSASASASTATNKASQASESAASAAQSAASASESASTATTKASQASESAESAAASATSASASATTATTKASQASESAESAAASATSASESASTATTKASQASELAESAASSASAASAQAIKAEKHADDSFEYSQSASSSAQTAIEKSEVIESYLPLFQEAIDETDANVSASSAYTSRAEAAAERAENATKGLDEAIEASEAATENARSATTDAIDAISNYESLRSALVVLRDNLSNTYIPTIESSITRSNTAISNATNLVNRGNTVLNDAQNAIDTMDSYGSEWITRRNSIDASLINVSEAVQRAEEVSQSIDDMSVTSESITSGTSSAEISDVGNHKNIHFKIRKGDPGRSYIIKGSVYSTVSELMENVQNPSEGDLYNVGSTPPYNVYRWTGSEWENQGNIGISVRKMTNEDVDDIFTNDEIEDKENKYMGAESAVYYTTEKLIPMINSKVDSVTGKGLSTNDFTDSYKDQILTNKTDITVLSSNKVDKISGKGLSTNDFTSAYRSQIESNKTSINDLTINSLVKDFSTYSNAISGVLNESLLAIRYGNETYKLTGAQLIADIISLGSVLTTGAVATVDETKAYLNIGV